MPVCCRVQSDVDRDHRLSVVRQAEALVISRSSLCYWARPASDADLAYAADRRAAFQVFPYKQSDVEGPAGMPKVTSWASDELEQIGIKAIYRRPTPRNPC